MAKVTDTEGRKHNEGSCEQHFLRRVARHLGWTSAVKGVESSHLILYWSPVRRSFHARPRWVHSLGIFDTRWAPGPLVRLMQLADGLQVRSRVASELGTRLGFDLVVFLIIFSSGFVRILDRPLRGSLVFSRGLSHVFVFLSCIVVFLGSLRNNYSNI